MRRIVGLLALILVGWSGLSPAEEVELDPKIQAGLTPGERADQFLVKDCTGPAAGKTLCYFCRYGLRPVVCVFSRSSDNLGPLVRGIDTLVNDRRDREAAGFVVYLGKDTSAVETSLKDVARVQQLRRTPLTIYKDRPDKIRDIFQISPDAEITVLIWKEGVVQDTLAFAAPQDGDLQPLLARIDRALVGK